MTDRSPRFLIVRLGSLGDVVHAIPAAAALRVQYPAARIDWMIEPRYVALLDLVQGIDHRTPVDTRGSIAALLATVRELRRTRYDAVVDLQGLLKSAVLARAAGASRTIGFARAHLREPLARRLYTQVVDPPGARHVMIKNLALLEPLGVRAPRIEFPLTIPRTAALDVVQAGGGGYVLINRGAAWPNKRWPAARFGAVAAAVHRTFGLRSIVLWGPGEEALASAVAGASGGAAEPSPPTSIVDLFALSRGARLLISGDTGPLHVAAAVGTPIVALFGPTRAERNGPWAAADVSLSRVDRCSCVYERRCRRAVPCIEDIGVAEVIQAVQRRMGVHG